MDYWISSDEHQMQETADFSTATLKNSFYKEHVLFYSMHAATFNQLRTD